MKRYKYSTFVDTVKEFADKKIMVVGDLILDRYVWGKVSRISPEAPVPVLLIDKEDSYVPGGGSNVASNLAELGTEVFLVGVVGKDKNADRLKGELKKRRINIDGVFQDAKRQTILKTRVMAYHHPYHQQVVRVDREDGHDISDNLSGKIIDYIKKKIRDVDALIVEDYGKGLMTSSLLEKIIDVAGKNKKIISVDPKENHFNMYKKVSVITPNRYEAAKWVGRSLDNMNAVKWAGEKLLKDTKSDIILITLGEEGMVVFQKGNKPQHIPTLEKKDVFDVSGAGDTVVGVYTLSLASGASPVVSAHIANCAAGIVVTRTGTAVVGEQELLDRLKKEAGRK
ncbi:MAG: D-glycero-beta-D-manno-heptose-7-phosphate kinase [Candidatus Omnitrophota bacterium]